MHRSVIVAIILSLTFIGTPSVSVAQTTSDQMTCQQAVATYERDGRIYVRTPRGAVIPVYRPLPVSQRSRVVCNTLSQQRGRYNVRTSDKRHCTIGYHCR